MCNSTINFEDKSSRFDEFCSAIFFLAQENHLNHIEYFWNNVT
uniref:Uncharacterized protein n=1 Tax=Tetranychus urticae TaxID=32264 RepID=T1L1G4_TETUR